MLKIRGKHDIYISRGDTKRLGINLTEIVDHDAEDYIMADDEYIVFKLRDCEGKRVIKELRSAVGTTIIDIPAEFTQQMHDNEFKYSVDLMLRDGTKETVIGEDATRAFPKFVILGA